MIRQPSNNCPLILTFVSLHSNTPYISRCGSIRQSCKI